MDGVSKNCGDFRIRLNLSDHQLKIDCYKHSLEYMKHMVTQTQKSVRDIQDIKRKGSIHNTIGNHQHMRGRG